MLCTGLPASVVSTRRTGWLSAILKPLAAQASVSADAAEGRKEGR